MKEVSADKGTNPKEEGSVSPLSLYQGKFFTAGSTPGRKEKLNTDHPHLSHPYRFKLVFAEGAIRLFNDKDYFLDLTMKLCLIYGEFIVVYPMVVVLPIKLEEDEHFITATNDIPLNLTKLQMNWNLPKNVSFDK